MPTLITTATTATEAATATSGTAAAAEAAAATAVSVFRDESHFVACDHAVVVGVLTNKGSALGESATWAHWDPNGLGYGLRHGWARMGSSTSDESHLVAGDHSVVVGVLANQGPALGKSSTGSYRDPDGVGDRIGHRLGHWVWSRWAWERPWVGSSSGDESHLVAGNHSVVVGILANKGSALGESSTGGHWNSNRIGSGAWWARGWVLGHHVNHWDTAGYHLGHRGAAAARLVDKNCLRSIVWLLHSVRNLLVHVDVDGFRHLLSHGTKLGDRTVGGVRDHLGDLHSEGLSHVTGAWHLHGLVRRDRSHAISAVFLGKWLGKNLGATVESLAAACGSCSTVHDLLCGARDKKREKVAKFDSKILMRLGKHL